MSRAIVIGGSIGGLLAANLLHRAGWQATVYERAMGDLSGRGAGLGVSQELIGIMLRAGARLEPSDGVLQRSLVWMDRDGRIVHQRPRNILASAWGRVYRPLRDALPPAAYHQGATLQSVEQDTHCVTARFADGSRASAELLVAADGALSTVRAQYLPEVQPRFANYIAWRGVVEERDMPRATVDLVAGRVVMCFGEGSMLLCMCVPGAGDDMRPGRRRMYFIWYRTTAPDALEDLFTGADGRNHGVSIPPPLIRTEHVEKLKADAGAALPPMVAEVIAGTGQPLLQAIGDMQSPRITFGRVAVMGDAAFVVRPHVAAGASKAGLDARCLVDALAEAGGDVVQALARYERLQQSFGARLVEHSRFLGTDLESGTARPDPVRMLDHYGAPHLLTDVQAAE